MSELNYEETLKYLYECVPMFQQIGSGAYKSGLDTTLALDEHFGHPHLKYRTIHVAGTNGKGSCSSTLAAILQSAGYKVGLFTSPHLIDFRERIRVNGAMIPKEKVVTFVREEKDFFEPLQPSFFELTTAMAMKHFADEQVDVAIMETGMGGRLDCTNIIHPDCCIITNISFDHMQFLGNTLAKIAHEKAGIIKAGIPAVIGECVPETEEVFAAEAKKAMAPLILADHDPLVLSAEVKDGRMIYHTADYGEIAGELAGNYQIKNTNTILHALRVLRDQGYQISRADIQQGFASVCEMTGFMGRWQQLSSRPTVICDAGHNEGGVAYLVEQFKEMSYRQLRIVIGMVSDKDIETILGMLPTDAIYYFTQASVKRALPAEQLKAKAEAHHLMGKAYPTVAEAVQAAQKESLPEDFIFVGGSCFIVADVLSSRDTLNFH